MVFFLSILISKYASVQEMMLVITVNNRIEAPSIFETSSVEGVCNLM